MWGKKIILYPSIYPSIYLRHLRYCKKYESIFLLVQNFGVCMSVCLGGLSRPLSDACNSPDRPLVFSCVHTPSDPCSYPYKLSKKALTPHGPASHMHDYHAPPTPPLAMHTDTHMQWNAAIAQTAFLLVGFLIVRKRWREEWKRKKERWIVNPHWAG